MVDQKITELDELTTPVSTDLLPIVEDPGGTPKTEKITLENLGLTNGWFPITKTLVYATADDPTFTFTIAAFDATTQLSPGMKIKLTNATVKYFIITKVVFDDPGSTITVYGGTDYNLVDAAITSPYYSVVKAPLGFPLDPSKWEVKVVIATTANEATPTASTWYNIGTNTIDIPIGIWDVYYQAGAIRITGTDQKMRLEVTLSTANNSESDVEYTAVLYGGGTGAGSYYLGGSLTNRFILDLSTKDTYYFNQRVVDAGAEELRCLWVEARAVLKAVCAYL